MHHLNMSEPRFNPGDSAALIIEHSFIYSFSSNLELDKSGSCLHKTQVFQSDIEATAENEEDL